MHSTLSSRDLEDLAARGISAAEIAAQVNLLRNPPPSIVLDRPATVGDGVIRLDPDEEQVFERRGAEVAARGRVSKFVPASGAASRMFKDLIAAASMARPSESAVARQFFERFDDFPFAPELRSRSGVAGKPATASEEIAVLRAMLHEMQLANRPKALIPFHRAPTGAVTAFDEQIAEGVRFLRDATGVARMHFTIPEESEPLFARALADVERLPLGESIQLDVRFSTQHPSTDTVAVTPGGELFRDGKGAILFRPGGHGALIRNLAELSGDIVVIKNIDNVLPAASQDVVIRWKHVLIGMLAAIEEQVHHALRALDGPREEREKAADEAMAVAATCFSRHPVRSLQTPEERERFAREVLDRPIRVCGVVRNEGEPGGAPFWTRSSSGALSLQIVESAQVDMSQSEQASIFNASTHFNPVDIVASLRSSSGSPFPLERFVDQDAVFVARRSHEGRELMALERPGLWNGAMAYWNTLCVEVPAATFAPVKTVFDLLRPQHQASSA